LSGDSKPAAHELSKGTNSVDLPRLQSKNLGKKKRKEEGKGRTKKKRGMEEIGDHLQSSSIQEGHKRSRFTQRPATKTHIVSREVLSVQIRERAEKNS
jgi:hypothetical protein